MKMKKDYNCVIRLTVFASILYATGIKVVYAQSDNVEATSNPHPHPIVFDTEILKNRGIDTSVSDYFKNKVRFIAGDRKVKIYLNDQGKGIVNATFDSDGEICFNKQFSESIGLKWDEEFVGCRDFLQRYPNTIIELHPENEEVRLIVSTDAINPIGAHVKKYATGGTAGIINYDFLIANNKYGDQSRQFQSLQTDVGLNAGDWIFRSRQSYYKSANNSRFEHLYAYGQKTFTKLGITLQAGQIGIENSIFPSYRINGLQLIPEAALQQGQRISKNLVEGIANSQARIEVRQNGVLIYSTVVPPGAYALTDIPLLNRSSDLDVKVIESDGLPIYYTVPAAELNDGVFGGIPGYSMAVGKYDPYAIDSDNKPMLVTGSSTWSLNRKTNFTAGIMAANNYHAGGWAIDHSLTDNTFLGTRQLISRAQQSGDIGSQLSVSISSQLSPSISGSLGVSRQTSGFRDLTDTLNDHVDYGRFYERYKSQYSGSLGWFNKSFGAWRVSYSKSSTFDGKKTHSLTGGWSKYFSNITASINFQHTGGTGARWNSGNSVLFSLSIPIGGKNIRTYVDHNSTRTRAGASTGGDINEYIGYNISSDYDDSSKEGSFSGNLNMTPRYFQANIGYAKNGAHNTMYSGSMRGGLVAHKDGITFSPYQISDTFGIAQVGHLRGVKISTSQGTVWTDGAGMAVISQLTPYATSRLEITPKSLPRNIDLVNGYQEIDVVRGSVQHIDFDVVETRRLLLHAKDEEGAYLPEGASVVDGNGNFIATVLGKGKVFLPNAIKPSSFYVEMPSGNKCELKFDLTKIENSQSYFDVSKALCINS